MRKILLSLTIIIFIILLNFRFYVYNINFYQKEFEKLNIYNKYTENEVLTNTNQLILYFKSNQELNTTFFNEKEKLHLIDVKNLINKTLVIFYITSIILIILLIINRKELTQSFLYAGISLILIPLLIYLTNFNFIFIKFHEIFFDNNLWLLNPETDNLINIFPKQFFIDFLKKIFINSLIIGIFLIILTILIKRYYKNYLKV